VAIALNRVDVEAQVLQEAAECGEIIKHLGVFNWAGRAGVGVYIASLSEEEAQEAEVCFIAGDAGHFGVAQQLARGEGVQRVDGVAAGWVQDGAQQQVRCRGAERWEALAPERWGDAQEGVQGGTWAAPAGIAQRKCDLET
jgi:hypothetical protein